MKLIKSAIIATVISLVLASCGESKKPEVVEKKIAVQTVVVKPQIIGEKLTYAGEIAPEDKTILSTKLMGLIEKLNIQEGDYVKGGEVLALISSKELQAKKMQLKANRSETLLALANSKKDFERYEKLKKQKSVSDKEFENVEMQYKMMQEKVKAVEQMLTELNETLKYTTVVAPYSGYVTKKFVNQGDMANPGMPIIAMEGNNRIKITAKIPENQISYYQQGDTAMFNIESQKNYIGKAIISHVNPSGDFTGKVYEISLRPISYPKSVKSGMYAKICLRRNHNHKIIVPVESLIKKGQLTGLWTVSKSKTAILRWVRTGKTYDDGVEIISGLVAGEEYIKSSVSRLVEGARLAV